MNTEGQHIEIRGLQVEIVRKDIKNLHVGVYPPNGRVRVAAPIRLNDDAVRLAVITRLGWIRRQQARYEKQQRQSEREMVSGETHFVQGRRYRMNVVERSEPKSVTTRNNTILEIGVRPGTGRAGKEVVLYEWYRQQLSTQLQGLIAKWEPKIGVKLSECRIRRMKTRWGSCNASARRIWLNLELAKKPHSCLEYILVHEMVHILERHHNENFRKLMDTFMPLWRIYREELNSTPLAHENWTY